MRFEPWGSKGRISEVHILLAWHPWKSYLGCSVGGSLLEEITGQVQDGGRLRTPVDPCAYRMKRPLGLKAPSLANLE